MRNKILAGLGAAALAIVGGVSVSAITAAEAQQAAAAPVILTLNQSQVLAQSKAGQSIGPQLAKLQEEASLSLNAEIEKVVKEGEDLKKQKDLMAEDVWLERAKRVTEMQNNLPALRDVRVQELSLAEQNALAKISEVMNPILNDIVKKRGATLLLDRSTVLFASIDTDITQEVVAALDKEVSSVKVEKVSMAELQRQAAEAAKAAEKDNGKKKKKKK